MNARRKKVSNRAETDNGLIDIAPIAADLRVGTMLAGYKIEALAGRGGMGVVYKGEHVHLRRTVAIKLLVPDLGDNQSFRDRFIRESRIAASIDHPNIITIYDAGEAEGLLYIAMRYVDGTDLGAVLEKHGALTPEHALTVVGQVGSALDAAHRRGIVHRDVKPGNVLIDDDRCYLTDFGLTKKMSSNSAMTAAGQFVGTIDYMAPEQIQNRDLDARTDVYALGCLLYHALTGAVPYEKDSSVSVMYAHLQENPPPLSERRPELPESLDAVIVKALAKEKEDRYASCSDLVEAARLAVAGERPLEAVDEAVAEPRFAAAPMRKILVAHDDAPTRALIRASLSAGRLRVIEAEDGDAALASARRERPDLAFVGSSLSASGVDLAQGLRQDPDIADMKIVSVISRSESRERRPLAGGADDYVTKPFSPLQLLFKVRDLLGPDVISTEVAV